MTKKFLRTQSHRYLRLGRKRKKIQKWRRPRGRHNKIRKKRFGYQSKPEIGYKSPKIQLGKVLGLNPILVHNKNELKNVGIASGIIIARVGAKKKLEIIKKAEEMKIRILNMRNKK